MVSDSSHLPVWAWPQPQPRDASEKQTCHPPSKAAKKLSFGLTTHMVAELSPRKIRQSCSLRSVLITTYHQCISTAGINFWPVIILHLHRWCYGLMRRTVCFSLRMIPPSSHPSHYRMDPRWQRALTKIWDQTVDWCLGQLLAQQVYNNNPVEDCHELLLPWLDECLINQIVYGAR